MIDGFYLKANDIELAFVAANSLKADYPYFTDRNLVRSKFLEAIVRLALDKYFKTKICSTQLEALQKTFEEHYLPSW
jgi:hypothetical protein